MNTQTFVLGKSERLMNPASDRLATLDSEELWQALRSDLEWEGIADVELLSLDVFDTVLVRDDKSEVRRFWEIAQRAADLTGADGRDLLVARLTATRASYRTSLPVDGYREGRLEDIYELVCAALPLREHGLARRLVEAEIEYEQSRLTLNPLVGRLIDHLGPDRVVYASNMYLSEGDVSTLLEGAGAHSAPVLTSTDRHCSKNDGRLLLLANASAASPDKCLHVGDSLTSDFAPAKDLGWHALLWPIPAKNVEARRADAVACISELEERGVLLGSLARHFVRNP